MINKANELGITVKELADKYIEEYFIDAKGLGINHATVHPRATENIDAIIDIIQKLVDSGYAYNVDGDVYYSTKKFKSYGKLSHQPLEDLESGARIEVNEDKRELWILLFGRSKNPENPHGKVRGGWDGRVGILNAALWLISILIRLLIFTAAVRILFSLIMKMKLLRARRQIAVSLRIIGFITVI